MTTVYDELVDVRELSAVQVEEWLGRRHGWAKRHISELGGPGAHVGRIVELVVEAVPAP